MTISIVDTLKPAGFGEFPTHEDVYGKGGYQVRDDISDRDSIPNKNRKEGMLVYVKSESKYYQLAGGITNLNWQEANLGSSVNTGGESAGGWITIFDVDCTTQSAVTYTTNTTNAQLLGKSWVLENMTSADSVSIVPGTGLVIDLNQVPADQYVGVYTAPSLILPIVRCLPDFNLSDYELRLWANIELENSDQDYEFTRIGFAHYPFFVNNQTKYFKCISRGYASGQQRLQAEHYQYGTFSMHVEESQTNALCIHHKDFVSTDYYAATVSGNQTFPEDPSNDSLYSLKSVNRSPNSGVGPLQSPVSKPSDFALHMLALAGPNNTSNSFKVIFKRLKLEYRLKDALASQFETNLDTSITQIRNLDADTYVEPDTNTLYHWKFDETITNNTTPPASFASSQTSNALTPVYRPAFTSAPPYVKGGAYGLFGNCVSFINSYSTNVNNGILYTQASTATNLSSGFTVSFWALPNQPPVGTSDRAVFQKLNYDISNSALHKIVIFITQDGRVRTYLSKSSGGIDEYTASNKVVTFGSWNYVSVTYDGSNLKMYINGVEGFSGVRTGFLDSSTSFWSIGAQVLWGNNLFAEASVGHHYNGLLEDLRIENTTRTSAHVLNVYNKAKKLFDSNSYTRSLVNAVRINDSDTLPNSRDYVENIGYRAHIHNAYWDATTSQWKREDESVASALSYIGTTRGTSGHENFEFASSGLLTKDTINNTWSNADWERNDFTVNVGTSKLISAPNTTKLRFTNLFLGPTNNEAGYSQIFLRGNHYRGSTNNSTGGPRIFIDKSYPASSNTSPNSLYSANIPKAHASFYGFYIGEYYTGNYQTIQESITDRSCSTGQQFNIGSITLESKYLNTIDSRFPAIACEVFKIVFKNSISGAVINVSRELQINPEMGSSWQFSQDNAKYAYTQGLCVIKDQTSPDSIIYIVGTNTNLNTSGFFTSVAKDIYKINFDGTPQFWSTTLRYNIVCFGEQ